MIILLFLSALFLAVANGANDNFKGFATVWGSGSLSYRKAILAASAATLGGSVVALFLAQDLVARFSGKGLVPDAVAGDPAFLTSAAFAAAATVMLATRLGMPVSTTHALLGGLIGAGAVASNSGIDLAVLGNGFVLPLLISPLIAAALGLVAYRFIAAPGRADCACLVAPAVTAAGHAASLATAEALPRLVLASATDCNRLPAPALRLSAPALAERVHIASATAICFARSVNDTPKLAALLLGAGATGLPMSIGLVAVMMVGGGLLMARRVAETMSLRINRLDSTQGVSANLITAGLVVLASRFGLPVSTTHVAVGSIAGVGARAGTLDGTALRSVLLSWVATLPCAAAIGWSVALMLPLNGTVR